ncbi:uncharacterized protein A4U43_C02F15660 [Asparagus officinalis]|uniref:H/ACA ribonucleoprotein complex subunit n=1 Tax=Asparagus officinalis TaxID=4686 RepID=A0A5P1FIQ5_ASPOF|nr:uncharacterized protein A4U43_C02F15660 [Asparagus officinalis]
MNGNGKVYASLEIDNGENLDNLSSISVVMILSNRVIVEGSEKHSSLNEGSILWITETRLPLGRIDEIFGPVKNPFYVVRYNSDDEVPQGISIGVAISFVVDFANHILNEKYLYENGYDASGIDDEEAADEVEFSDDEKEAEYKRSLRQTGGLPGNFQWFGGLSSTSALAGITRQAGFSHVPFGFSLAGIVTSSLAYYVQGIVIQERASFCLGF